MVTSLLNFNNKPHFGQDFESGHWARKGLLAHYPFIKFGSLIDVSVNKNHGIINGATWDRNRLTFNGTSNYVDVSGVATLLRSVASWSLSFWAESSIYNLSTACAVSIQTGAAADDFVLYPFDVANGNGVRLYFNGNIIDQDSGAAPINRRNNYVYTQRSATDHEMFVNNISVGTSSTSNTHASDIDHFFIGSWQTSTQFFAGLLDNLRVYIPALLPSQRKELYYDEYPEYRGVMIGRVPVVVGANPWYQYAQQH